MREGPLKRAVCLVSGGIDSTVTLAIAMRDGFETYALTVRYGQRHACELTSAALVANTLGAREHRVVDVDLRSIGGSSLTADLAVPKDRSMDEMGSGVPLTYVPARNTVFLAIALGWAELLGSQDLFFGANILDYSGYPDCRPEFIQAFEHLAARATKAGADGAQFHVHAPLLHLTKAAIIRLGHGLGVDFGLTWSCYDPSPNHLACGRCDACQIRRRGFVESGLLDPTPYEPTPYESS